MVQRVGYVLVFLGVSRIIRSAFGAVDQDPVNLVSLT